MAQSIARQISAPSLPRKLSAFFNGAKSIKTFLKNIERLSKQLTHGCLRLDTRHAALVFPSAAATFYFSLKVGYARPAQLDDVDGEFVEPVEFALDAAATLRDFQFLADAIPFSVQFFPERDALCLVQSAASDGAESEVLTIVLRQLATRALDDEEESAELFRLATDSDRICELRSTGNGGLALVFDSLLRGKASFVYVSFESDRVAFLTNEQPTHSCRRKAEVSDPDWVFLKANVGPTTLSFDVSSFEVISQLLKKANGNEHSLRLSFTRRGLMLLSSEFNKDLFQFDVIFTARENV